MTSLEKQKLEKKVKEAEKKAELYKKQDASLREEVLDASFRESCSFILCLN